MGTRSNYRSHEKVGDVCLRALAGQLSDFVMERIDHVLNLADLDCGDLAIALMKAMRTINVGETIEIITRDQSGRTLRPYGTARRA